MFKALPFIILFIFLNAVSFANEFVINKIISYPYKASTDKANKIKTEYKKVSLGMSATEVVDMLGKPDETRPLFEPIINNGKQIGFTHWYLIQRLKKDGPVNEKQEKLVRISYNQNWTVIAIDHWGFY